MSENRFKEQIEAISQDANLLICSRNREATFKLAWKYNMSRKSSGTTFYGLNMINPYKRDGNTQSTENERICAGSNKY